MTKMFEVPTINDEKGRYFHMNTNVLAGFKTSVAQGQPNLALKYLEYVIDILVKQIESIDHTGEVVAEEVPVPEKPAKTKLTKTADVSAE